MCQKPLSPQLLVSAPTTERIGPHRGRRVGALSSGKGRLPFSPQPPLFVTPFTSCSYAPGTEKLEALTIEVQFLWKTSALEDFLPSLGSQSPFSQFPSLATGSVPPRLLLSDHKVQNGDNIYIPVCLSEGRAPLSWRMPLFRHHFHVYIQFVWLAWEVNFQFRPFTQSLRSTPGAHAVVGSSLSKLLRQSH